MIASFATAGVLTAPPAALNLNGYVPGNTLAAQHLNYYLNHLTLELNNLLTAGGVVQNSGVDTQVGTAVQNVAQKALAIFNGIRLTTGSALTIPIGSGTVVIATGSNYTATLPSAASAFVQGFEVDIQNHNSGATYPNGSVFVNLLNPNDALAGITGGSWQITEQYGHLRVRPAPSGAPSGYGWVVESCDGTVYRNVKNTNGLQPSPTLGTWYNVGGSLTVPAGVYFLSWGSSMYMSPTVGGAYCDMNATLSTGASSESDGDFSYDAQTSGGTIATPASRVKRVVLSSPTTFYLNAKGGTGGAALGNLGFLGGGGSGSIIIEAKRVA